MPTKEPPDVLTDVLWVESHRPTSLAALALEQDNREVLAAYIKAGEIPHLLLVGPPGSGKTTVSRILCNTLDCRRLVLNASDDRGIDTVRHKVKTFAQTMASERWSIVFLDEADKMTSDAQTALRNLIEAYADRTRFILTANQQFRIIGAIQDRCQILTLAAPPLKERYRILAAVLKLEGIAATPQITLGYAERYPSMRQVLMIAQKAYLASGKKRKLPAAKVMGSNDGATILALVTGNNWTGLRQLTTNNAFDPLQGLRELFWAIPDDHPRGGFLRHVIGRGVHESGFTPDPVIHFLGVCSEAMEGLAA